MESSRRRGRLDGINEDVPMYSRLFIVCGKNATEDQLRDAFDKFGTIEDFYMPQDYKTGISKGIAYIKYSKTSEAAQAVEEMNLKVGLSGSRAIKVMVAISRSDIQTDDSTDDPDKFRRIFIHVPKSITEEELADKFGQFGHVKSAVIQRNHDTGESKGFAYITFQTFYEAALAFENADKKYRVIFAKPKNHNRRPETSFEANINKASHVSLDNTLFPMMNVLAQGYMSVIINCSPVLTQHHIKNLFDLIPGMVNCQYAVDLMRRFGKGTITYCSPVSAAYAVQKLDGFEYPPGQRIMVKPDYNNFIPEHNMNKAWSNLQSALQVASNTSTPDLAQLATAIAEASKLIKTATMGITDKDIPDSNDLNYCSVPLPPPQPLADINATVVKRCFLVCKPQPPPQRALRDVFCRFGDLITAYTLPNKTVGYVCYASAKAADQAIQTLHGAELCGVRMKVLEAEDEDPSAQKRKRFY